MFTKLFVVNEVLNEISSPFVDNITDSDASIGISHKLDLLLPELLRRTDWNFAIKYISDNTPLIENFSPEYRYSYNLPPDFGRLDRFYNNSGFFGGVGTLPWRIIDGQMLSNNKPVQYYYVVRTCAYEVLTPPFLRALIMYCAAKVAPALTEDLMLIEYLAGEWEDALAEAIEFNDMERPISTMITADYARPNIV